MISMVAPLPAGNALRLFLEPVPGAVRWKVLRKGSPTFSGHNDASALVVHDGSETVLVDTASLQNEVMQFYQSFYTEDGVVWTPGPVTSGTPSATYGEQTVDVLSKLRDRLEAGLKVECDRGNFQTEIGHIPVYTAPPVADGNLPFPLVSLHLDDASPSERGVGEMIGIDVFDSIGDDWIGSEGWLEGVKITAIGWSLNADERDELRRAMRRVLLANLPVFESYGWTEFSASFQHVDAVSGEYNANIFQVMSSISCVAPVVVSAADSPIRDVVSTAYSHQEAATAATP